ncbi:MAG: hypothetical protein CMP48_03185 [Rickettsiales bacterium]|nr:hypothetical protein [Rickettsiales bacterium]
MATQPFGGLEGAGRVDMQPLLAQLAAIGLAAADLIALVIRRRQDDVAHHPVVDFLLLRGRQGLEIVRQVLPDPLEVIGPDVDLQTVAAHVDLLDLAEAGERAGGHPELDLDPADRLQRRRGGRHLLATDPGAQSFTHHFGAAGELVLGKPGYDHQSLQCLTQGPVMGQLLLLQHHGPRPDPAMKLRDMALGGLVGDVEGVNQVADPVELRRIHHLAFNRVVALQVTGSAESLQS